MMLDGAGFRADGKALRPRTRPICSRRSRCSGHVPLITAVLGVVGRPRRPGRADVRLLGDERARVDLHRRSAGGRSSRWGRRSPRRSSAGPVGRDRQRADPQRRARRRRRARPRAPLPAATSRRRRGRTRPTYAARRHRAARSSTRCSTSCRATASGSYDVRDVIDVVVRRSRRGSRCNPTSGRRWSRVLARLGGHPVAVDRQPAAGARRLDRRRRRRQGRALHHRRRLVPPSAGLPRRQPRRAPRHRVGEARHPARGRPHVRGARRWRRRRSSR